MKGYTVKAGETLPVPAKKSVCYTPVSMRTSAGAMLLLPVAFAFGAEVPVPRLDSPAALDAFFFPAAEEDIFDSMRAVFRLDNPGVLVSAAANAGPEYAAKVAASLPDAEFRRHYALLSKYLEMFGPCQQKQKPDTPGWWSNYTEFPGEAYCGEAAKGLSRNNISMKECFEVYLAQWLISLRSLHAMKL